VNGGDDVTVTATGSDESFTFPTKLDPGTTYEVAVTSQPDGQTCSVTNGTGTMADGDVTNVSVSCAVSKYKLGGKTVGLTGTVKLKNNVTSQTIEVTGATFDFDDVLHGDDYDVQVVDSPSGQVCTSSNNVGTATADVTNITVTCVGPLRVFTSTQYSVDVMGGHKGIAFADEVCAGDANNPDNTATWKALLVDGTTRNACANANCDPAGGQVDWVFTANMEYIRASDSVIIGTTNDHAIFAFNLSAPFDENDDYWTGLNGDWTSSGANCSSWASEFGTGSSGSHGKVDAAAINDSTFSCDSTVKYLCVEQP